MAQFIPSAPGTRPYKMHPIAMALSAIGEGGQGLTNAIKTYREAETMKTPLAQYLGMDPATLPESLRPFAATPMGRFRSLGDAVGQTSFGSLLRLPTGGPSVPFFVDPVTGQFSMTGGAGMTPVPGMGGAKAVGALQKQQALQTQAKALRLRQVISDRLSAKDSREEERLALSQLKLAIDPYLSINMDQLPPEAMTRFSSLLDQSLTTVEALKGKGLSKPAPAAPAAPVKPSAPVPKAKAAPAAGASYRVGSQVRTPSGQVLTLVQTPTGFEWK